MTSLTLATPDSFPAFPFQPYDIQLALMKVLIALVQIVHLKTDFCCCLVDSTFMPQSKPVSPLS